jgi:hypothetical protein
MSDAPEPTAEHIAEARRIVEGLGLLNSRSFRRLTDGIAHALAAAEARGFERGRQSALDVCDAEIAVHESVPTIRAIGNVRARILQAKEPR